MIKIILSILLFLNISYASERCQQYIQQVRVAHYEVFGLDYPYWYGVGQLEQESACRNIISRDGVGSQGLPQITFRVWKKFLKNKGIKDLNTVGSQLHAQAYIMKNSKQQAYTSHLFGAYMVYNGGHWINKEISRARKALKKREISWCEARKFCKRGYVHFNNGQIKSACDINYEYPKRIYKYGEQYNLFGEHSKTYKFW